MSATQYMIDNGFYAQLEKTGVVPVVVLEKVEDAVPMANALVAGGLPAAEVTFRTAAAADCIKKMADECPDILVGAGTVVNLEQCKRCLLYTSSRSSTRTRSCSVRPISVTCSSSTPRDVYKRQVPTPRGAWEGGGGQKTRRDGIRGAYA